MTCRQYIDHLSSGQLDEAGLIERFWAAQHRMLCRRCSAFTRNDARLSDIVRGYREHVARPDASPQEDAAGIGPR